MKWIVLLAVFCCGALAEQKRYDGYHVISVAIGEEAHVDVLRELERKYDGQAVDFWSSPVIGREVTLSASGDLTREILRTLDHSGLRPVVLEENLQTVIDESRADNEHAHDGFRKRASSSINFLEYNRFSTISSYLDSLAAENSLCSTFSLGKSSEGRDLKVLKISTGGFNKPAIWLDAGIHAREWAAPATALYTIDKLVSTYTSDATTRAMLDKYDWYIMPVLNPDGYEYSHTNDRMWRKTRSRTAAFCVGTDGNRNWDHYWMHTGASSNPCSSTYGGPRAFSEPETSLVADFLSANSDQIIAYTTLHAYGQYWMTPWGYTSSLPSDYNELVRVANAATSAIYSYDRKRYTVGSSTNVLYAAAGGSDDWAKGVAGIKYAYCIELRDTGRYGFMLPTNQLQDQGEEFWAGVQAMATALP